jgi:PAS domain S-box-containing protein
MMKNKLIFCCLFVLWVIVFTPMSSVAEDDDFPEPGQRILKSASELDYPPFCVVQNDGTPDGFSVDLLKAVTRAVGLDVNFIVGPWYDIKSKLINGHLDVLPLVSYSNEQDKVLDFTAPYLRMHGAIFVRKEEKTIHGEKDLKGKEVLVMRGDTAHEYALKKNLSDKLILTDSFEKAMVLLSKGRHDAVIIQQLVGLQLIKQLNISNIVSVRSLQESSLKPVARPLSGFEQKFCIAVQEGDTKLLALLNEGLAIVIANGVYEELYDKWFGPILPQPHFSLVRMAKPLAFILVPVLCLMGILWIWRLKSEVTRKTGSLRQEIKERKIMEEALRESEEEIKSIFRVAPTGIGVASDRVIRQVNDRICEMTGYSRNELIGQSARILYPDEEDYEYVGKEKYKQIAENQTGTVETRFKRKNGEIIDVLMSSTPLDPANLSAGVTFTVLDITEQKQNERDTQTLVESTVGILGQELFDIIVIKLCEWLKCDCAIIGEIIAEDTVKAVSMVLDGAPVKNFSYNLKSSPCAETVRQCYCVYPENVCALFPENSALVEMDAVGYVGTSLEDRNGKTIGVLCGISRNRLHLTKHTQNVMKIIAARVSAEIGRKKIEKEKELLETRLRQAQRMEAIGTLAGGIAHDFNNILFPIVGHTEMLLEDMAQDSPFRNSLDEIYTAALRAKDLVKQILTFSRQDDTEFKLIKIQVIVKETLKLIRSTIPTTIDIKQNIVGDCGPIKADPTQIHQLIMNLATNAYHAMEDTGGILTVGLKQVQLGEHDIIKSDMMPGAYACLTVADTGTGMDKNVAEKIFDPFFTTKGKGKGTGMGLSVVHGIIRSMKGMIRVYSEPGKGTIFHVYLPVVKGHFKKQMIYTQGFITGGAEQILFVDDEQGIVTMGKQMLERLGYRVTARTSSIETLKAFQSNPDKFDLVITDMAMPNMPGDRLAAELIRLRPDIPILLCTGFSETMSEEKARALGIKGFILKPMVMKDLSQKIREVLDKNKTVKC